MPEAIGSKVAEFGRQASPGSWFLAKDSEIDDQRELIPYSHYLRLAWTELDLSGVLCVDGPPRRLPLRSYTFHPGPEA